LGKYNKSVLNITKCVLGVFNIKITCFLLKRNTNTFNYAESKNMGGILKRLVDVVEFRMFSGGIGWLV